MNTAAAFRVVIPARLNSSRLPGKVLMDIGGKPMLQHVYEKAVQSNAHSIVIAVDNEEIKVAVEKFTDAVVMTRVEHRSGTERIAEVAAKLNWDDNDIVVNVQGDEPLIPCELIKQVATNLAHHPLAAMTTLYKKFTNQQHLHDPNYVKVVTDKNGYALYFSRSVIPCNGIEHYHHVGIYAYRVSFIKHYFELEPSPLEVGESLEQLRALWHGYKIHVAEACVQPQPEVNTLEHLELVREIYTRSGYL